MNRDCATHARLWRRMPSPYPEISVWGSTAGPCSYVVTYNTNTRKVVASFKRLNVQEAATLIGTFDNTTQAFEACEKHYRSNLS
jgi:hypothetical protein